MATKTGSGCVQWSHVAPIDDTERVIGAEDCLYLNVYVPETEKSTPLPVIVWIHGGAFQWDMEYYNGQFAKPDYLMDRDVIVVTLSYRLGPLGAFIISNVIRNINIFSIANSAIYNIIIIIIILLL